MKRSLAAAAALSGLFVLAACDGRSEAAPEAASSATAVETPASDAPPEVASPAIADAPAALGAGAPAVGDAPAFASLYPGAVVNGAPTLASGPAGPGGVVVFTTDAPPETIVAYYRQRAEAAGLRPIMSMNQGDARAYGAAASGENGASLQVVASPGDGGLTSVQLTWSAGV